MNFLMQKMDLHVAILISSLIFAICHCYSLSYIVLVLPISLYLSYAAILFSPDHQLNLVPAILIHSFYDFFAFIYILYEYRKKQKKLYESRGNAESAEA
ncbi:MAG: CPBP family intramembrane glutamic endopeptidase [Planctomycetaceae bacterium]